MFNDIDVKHMSTRIDLTSHSSVAAAASKIASRLKQTGRTMMPPEQHGGPWPEEWIALFDRWVAEGCPE
jgi:hypothetical protein